MEVIYTYLKINMNSYRIRISIYIRRLLKIINFRDVENQSYPPKLSIGIFQYSVQPWPTDKGVALNLFHQSLFLHQKPERLCPSSSEIQAADGRQGGLFWPYCSRCAGLWNCFVMGKR